MMLPPDLNPDNTPTTSTLQAELDALKEKWTALVTEREHWREAYRRERECHDITHQRLVTLRAAVATVRESVREQAEVDLLGDYAVVLKWIDDGTKGLV